MGFFNPDGKFLQTLGKMFDLLLLNIVFLITCIPIFTIGASVTSLYYVTLKMVKNEESYVVRSYFKSFRQNFKQATAIWLILLLVALMSIGGIVLAGQMTGIAGYLRYLFASVLVFEGLLLCYVFPVLSRFDNTVKNILKYSMMMVARHFPWSILLLTANLCPVVLLWMASGRILWFLIGLMLALGFSAFALLCSWCFVEKIFPMYMPEED